MGNTNIEGKTNIMFAMTSIKGIGRRYANLCLKKADIPLTKRAGELSEEEVEKLVTIVQNPRQYKIPEDLERLKKIRSHRGLRHYWGLRTRGQHTKTTGHKGKTVGVSKKK